jgi:hypothetical protein
MKIIRKKHNTISLILCRKKVTLCYENYTKETQHCISLILYREKSLIFIYFYLFYLFRISNQSTKYSIS